MVIGVPAAIRKSHLDIVLGEAHASSRMGASASVVHAPGRAVFGRDILETGLVAAWPPACRAQRRRHQPQDNQHRSGISHGLSPGKSGQRDDLDFDAIFRRDQLRFDGCARRLGIRRQPRPPMRGSCRQSVRDVGKVDGRAEDPVLARAGGASSRSISPSTWRVCPSTSADGSVATWPARKTKPLATTACDMRAPGSSLLMQHDQAPSFLSFIQVAVGIAQRQHQQQHHANQGPDRHDRSKPAAADALPSAGRTGTRRRSASLPRRRGRCPARSPFRWRGRRPGSRGQRRRSNPRWRHSGRTSAGRSKAPRVQRVVSHAEIDHRTHAQQHRGDGRALDVPLLQQEAEQEAARWRRRYWPRSACWRPAAG